MLHPVFARLANAVLPHQCLLCRQFAETAGLCGTCWTGLKPISAPMCDICGRPLPHQLPQGRCGHCWLRPPPLERMRAWCLYNDTSRDLILKFKHGGGLFLTPFFAAMMTGLCRELLTPDTLIIPVPLHRWRYLKRRYNQSAELARALAGRHDPQQFAPDSFVSAQKDTQSGRTEPAPTPAKSGKCVSYKPEGAQPAGGTRCSAC